MNKQQLADGLIILQGFYDNFRIIGDNSKFNAWYAIFKNDDPKEFMDAVLTYSSTNKFKPNPAGIRECMTKLKTVNKVSAEDCWDKIMKCIHNYGYYRLDEAYKSLENDPTTLKMAKIMNLKELCLSENIMADRAHFLKMFDTMQKRENDRIMIPKQLQQKYSLMGNMVKQLSDGMEIK